MAHDSDKKNPQGDRSKYWRRTRNLTLYLLLIWFLLTFLVVFFARELSSLRLFGWPVSFYLAAQGTTLIYVGIVAFYCIAMHRLDKTLIGHDADGR
jgi:putative solute:sodium symporter small subunit